MIIKILSYRVKNTYEEKWFNKLIQTGPEQPDFTNFEKIFWGLNRIFGLS